MVIVLSVKEFTKVNIENFTGNELGIIKEEINKQYNMDIEAIRNLGAISKLESFEKS